MPYNDAIKGPLFLIILAVSVVGTSSAHKLEHVETEESEKNIS